MKFGCLLRLTLVPILIFTAVMLLIHTQPYDDHELRQLLLPEGCPAPCFMGIQPGVTTADEAIRILESTGWLDQYSYQDYETRIRVQWNDQIPAWLKNKTADDAASIWIKNGLVDQFFIKTNLMLGFVDLAIGRPRFQYISLYGDLSQSYLFYEALYPETKTDISIRRDCNLQKGSIKYQDTVTLHYAQWDVFTNVSSNYHHLWLEVMHTLC